MRRVLRDDLKAFSYWLQERHGLEADLEDMGLQAKLRDKIVPLEYLREALPFRLRAVISKKSCIF